VQEPSVRETRKRPALFQSRQVLWLYKETNGSGLPGGFFDEAVALQGLDHFVDRGWGNMEVALQVRLCRSLAVDLGVAVDEAQILTLLLLLTFQDHLY